MEPYAEAEATPAHHRAGVHAFRRKLRRIQHWRGQLEKTLFFIRRLEGRDAELDQLGEEDSNEILDHVCSKAGYIVGLGHRFHRQSLKTIPKNSGRWRN